MTDCLVYRARIVPVIYCSGIGYDSFMVGCRGVAPTVEATGGSGLLPGAAPEVAGMPVCKVHHDDFHPSLQNPLFSFFPGSQTGST